MCASTCTEQHLRSQLRWPITISTSSARRWPRLCRRRRRLNSSSPYRKRLIPLLDAAGIKRAVILSTAYIWSQPRRKVENDYEEGEGGKRLDRRTRWRFFPTGSSGSAASNPVREYALEELARCSKNPHFRGLKLHFGNSAVDCHNADHIARVRLVFRAANGYRMPIVVHMRATISDKLAYGADEALIFLNEILPEAPDVPVQIAHMAGAGGYDDPLVDQALSVFVEAIARGRPHEEPVVRCDIGRGFEYTGAGRSHCHSNPATGFTADSLRDRRGDTRQFAA